MPSPQEYLTQVLNQLTESGKGANLSQDIVDSIFSLLLSKKFRKYSVPPEYQDHIRQAIHTSISQDQPIKLAWVFGGYKLWRLEEAPEVDWAELFSLVYFTHWLSPICTIYKPGVWFDFFSDDIILEPMNNIPRADTEQYIKTFRELLNFFRPLAPSNLNFTLNRVGDQYDSLEAFRKDLESSMSKTLPTLLPEQISAIDLNVKLNPDQDKDPLWRGKVQQIHDAYAKVSKRRPYYRNPEKIMVVNMPVNDSLAVGTCKKSIVKFWVGAGILEKHDDTFIENICSPKQLASKNLTKVGINLAGLGMKNFRRIKVVLEKNGII